MRTSPLGMRRRHRRAPLVLLILLLALAAACSDDGDDGGATPTTTSPATTESSDGGDGGDTTTAPPEDDPTTSPPTEATEPGAIPGDDADVLTPEQAEAQLEALVAAYRDAVVATATSRALDERALASFNSAFTGSRAQQELDGLQSAGVELLNPTPPEVAVSDVAIAEATPGCASGTVVVEGLAGLVTVPVTPVQPYYFRLVPAADGAAAPAWRLDFFNFSDDGVPLEGEAACA